MLETSLQGEWRAQAHPLRVEPGHQPGGCAARLHILPAACASTQGTLAALDSKNPVMYLDFPQGRYKLFGGYFNRCRLRNVLCLLPCCGGSR